MALHEFLPDPLNILIGPIMIGLGLAFFILSKKYLIKPRIGTVKFGRKRKVRKLKTIVVLSVNVVVTIFSWDIGAMLILFLGKKFITTPRMGFVKFGQIRKKRNKFLALFLGLMVVFTVITFILTLLGMFQLQLPGFLVMLLIGLLFITLPFSILAYYLQLKRLFLYALLGGLGLFISELLLPIFGAPFHDIITFGGIGLVITITGLII
ncbi:unnamed protein product, partial [marine sediment metagenome]